MARIAFCGLGQMGAGMAASLLRAGHTVSAWNRSPAKTATLAKVGATIANSPAAAAEGADITFVMVSDDEASRSLWLGATGLLEAMEAGSFAAECSTLSHAWVCELAETASRKQIRFLDCPVTGLPDTAARGELTLLLGADPKDFEDSKTVLAALSKEVIHFGAVGAGTAYKLIVNLLGAVEIAATAEAMESAARAGLDLSQVADALAKGAAGSFHVGRQARIMATGSHAENLAFTTDLRRKDTRYGVQLSQEFGVASALGVLTLAQFDHAANLGFGAQAESHVLDAVRDQSRKKSR
ncbi:MAG TPA: NAD(P)-dependent oxidoreductase [Myxococcales bacterium]|nr:NAD(P)-dependent oxidoreductase [Myxococcales bacterium]HIK83870.1 NAD(P)-dependent oxidoreductase [Myxococcales bacterium]